MVTCKYCPTKFKPAHKNNTMCSDPACKKRGQKERMDKYIAENPSANTEAARKRRARDKKAGVVYKWPAHRALGLEIRALKESTPCKDCDTLYPFECMDFDHVEEGTKHHNVGTMVAHGHNREKVMAEIAKCDLVCSNCHRIRTRKRRLEKGKTDDESGIYGVAEDDEAF